MRRKFLFAGLPATIFFLAAMAVSLFARAGGGGGGGGGGSSGGGGGGSGGGDGEIIIYIIFLLIQSGPPGWITLGVLGVGGFVVYRISQKSRSSVNHMPIAPQKPLAEVPGAQAFLAANAGFDEAAFLAKVQRTFLDIQAAWGALDVAPVRRFMSDGVYRRFTTQLAMMKSLGQRDEITGAVVRQAWIDRVESDGAYDILHVGIRAGMSDKFVCEKMPELNSPGGYEEFTEYWSFLRRRNGKVNDAYTGSNCPNCASPLPLDMGDAGQCPACKAFVSSGQYDWVLSEITQTDDYAADRYRSQRVPGLSNQVGELVAANIDFAVQLLEDKASDAYLQVLRATAERDPKRMRRFTTDAAYAKLEQAIPGQPFLYNRLWLNAVSLVAARSEDNVNRLYFAVRSSFQRVRIAGLAKPETMDGAIVSAEEIVVLARSADAGQNKGSLYSHRCPSCGATAEDSLELKCAYCGEVYNNLKNEWILDAVMPMAEFRAYLDKNRAEFDYALQKSLVELYQVRDYAWNNALLVMAADGEFQEQERRLALALAKKWSIEAGDGKLEHWFELAKTGQLAVRMPDQPARRQQVWKLMQRAAQAAGGVSPEEQKILDTVQSQFLAVPPTPGA